MSGTDTTLTAVVGTGLITVMGTWAEGQKLSIRPVIGGTFLALALTGISQASPQFASRLALLVLVGAAFRYVPSILSKTGLAKTSAPGVVRQSTVRAV